MTDFLEMLIRAAAEGTEDASADSANATGTAGTTGVTGAWLHLETVAFECLANGIADDRAAALLRMLGFDGQFACFAIAGRPATTGEAAMQSIVKAVTDLGGARPLTGMRDGTVAALIRLEAAASPEVTCTAVAPAFAVDDPATPLCLGPVRHGVSGAAATLGAALTTLAVAPAITGAAPAAHQGQTAQTTQTTQIVRNRIPAPLRAEDALPERALLGDADARRELVDVVYASLVGDNPDDPTMLTVSTFLESGSSLETTARALNVHPNTVRYRLKRAADTTGWDATNPREAYVLTTAITLGRIHGAEDAHKA